MLRPNRKTVADYMALPEYPRVELIDGEFFVTAAPNLTHQRVIRDLILLLQPQVERLGLGEVFQSPVDVVLSDEDVVQPDVLFVAADHKARLENLVNGPPDLAVEVLSPWNSERDRTVKRDLYLESGVEEYWIADPETRTVEVRRRKQDAWEIQGLYACGDEIPSAQLPGVRIPVSEIFR